MVCKETYAILKTKLMMNKTLLGTVQVAFMVLLFSFTTTKISAPTWNIDAKHTKLSFEVNHFFTPVEGYFENFEGELNFDRNNLEGSSAKFTVKVASVKTNSSKRDNHLKSSDFFNADKFPEIKFESSEMVKTENGLLVIGKLTIRNVTKKVEVPFEVLGMGPHPMKKEVQIIGIKGGFTINRNDYGVGSGSWAATAVVGDEVIIKIVIEATRKA